MHFVNSFSVISVLFYHICASHNNIFVYNRSSCTMKKKVVVTDRLVIPHGCGYFSCLANQKHYPGNMCKKNVFAVIGIVGQS